MAGEWRMAKFLSNFFENDFCPSPLLISEGVVKEGCISFIIF
jgi:hypothetical protein